MVMLEMDKDLARIGAGWYGPAIGSHQARRAFRCRSGIQPSLRRACFGIAQLHGESTLQAHFRAANHQVPMTPQRRAARFLQGRARGLHHN